MDFFKLVEKLSENPTIANVVGTLLAGILLAIVTRYIYRKIKMPKITIEGEEAIKKYFESLVSGENPEIQHETR